MPSPDSKARTRADLVDLIESQGNPLEKANRGVVTAAEVCEYEDRRSRICQIHAETTERQPRILLRRTGGIKK